MKRDGCLELGLTAEQALERIAVRTVDEIGWDRQGREFQLLLVETGQQLRGVVEERAGGCRVRWTVKGPEVRFGDYAGILVALGCAAVNLFFLPIGEGMAAAGKVQALAVLALIHMGVSVLRYDAVGESELLDLELRTRLAAA